MVLAMKKVSTQLTGEIFRDLEAYVSTTGVRTQDVYNQAVAEFLAKKNAEFERQRAIDEAADAFMRDNDKLLRRLAQ